MDGVHTDERRLATDFRAFKAVEYRAETRRFDISEIGVILLRSAIGTDMFAVFDNIRDDEDFRMAVEAEVLKDMFLQSYGRWDCPEGVTKPR